MGIAGSADALSPGGGIGIGYLYPVSREISRAYGGGISFHAVGELPVARALRVAAEIGYQRSGAPLSHPDFVGSAKGVLEAYPIDIVARLETTHVGVIRPHVGGGIEMLWLKESFSYRMSTRVAKRSPDARFGIGPVLVAGIDRTESPRFRIEAVASLIPLRRGVSAGKGEYDAGRITAGFLGARILWRFH